MPYIEGDTINPKIRELTSGQTVVTTGTPLVASLWRADGTQHGSDSTMVYTAPPAGEGWVGSLQLPDEIGGPGVEEEFVVRVIGDYAGNHRTWNTTVIGSGKLAG